MAVIFLLNSFFAIINISTAKRGEVIMDEFSFIQSIQQKTYQQSSIIKGIGDDAAVFREPVKDIVTAVDVFVEGIHFSKETMKPFHIGYRALAANLSDMAAMGATPVSILVAVVIPKQWSSKELEEVFSGIKLLAKKYKIDLIGGDTVSGANLTLSITINGTVEKEKARYRSTAKSGDIVFVTGTLGDSQAGFHILTNPEKRPFQNEKYFIKRHQMPSPRVDFGKSLASISSISLNDISDGIANEAAEIANASNVSIHLYEDAVPVSKSFNQFPTSLQAKWKLFGGEDFELLGTVAKEEWPKVQYVAEQKNTKISKIGYVTLNEDKKSRVYLINNKKEKVILKKEGYTHLK